MVYLQFNDVKPSDVKSFSKSVKTIKECLEKKPTETDHQKVYEEEVNDLKDRINDFLSVSTLTHDIICCFYFPVSLCQSIVLHFLFQYFSTFTLTIMITPIYRELLLPQNYCYVKVTSTT